MTRFLPYIHNLRGLAILFIVGVHARAYEYNWAQHPEGYDFFVTLFDNGTVLFVFIAGFLFQHLNHGKFDLKNYFRQKLRYVALPYLIISIPILIFRLVYGAGELHQLPEGFDDHSLLYKIFFYLATGMHMVPFWFMPMIFLIYLTSPLLHALDQKKFYQFVLPVIFTAGMYTYRPLNNSSPVLAYLHFLPIYLTGMGASFYKKEIVALYNKILIPLIFIYAAISAAELADLITLDKKMNFNKVLNESLLVFNVYVFKAMILCFILMLLFYKYQDRKFRLLNLLGSFSFGIYFLHFYFISFFRQALLEMQVELSFTVISFLGFYALILLLSIAAVYLIKLISGKYSRYLVGS
ncbi:MAG: acyltransferase [Bacteroidota bacterium]